MAISSLIHALYETSSLAIARLVTKDGKDPVLVALAPSIEPEYECLLEVELPFNEDVRSYRFPPLDKIVTISGKNVVQHRYLPNEELMQSMSDYVDSMDLSTLATKSDEYVVIRVLGMRLTWTVGESKSMPRWRIRTPRWCTASSSLWPGKPSTTPNLPLLFPKF